MKRVKIDSSKLNNWKNFHNEFSEKFEFPDYYGRNMDAWIDCMDDLVEELTIIDLGDCRSLKENNSEILKAILEYSAYVNFRKLEEKIEPTLVVSMY